MDDYRHTQVGWLILGVIVLADAIAVVAVVLAGVPWVALLVVASTAILGLLFGWLTSAVDDERLSVQFGVGVIHRSWRLEQIATSQVVRTPWWVGWGIRYMPGRTVYSVSGLDAVEFETVEGKTYRIGTDDPEGLRAALSARLEGQADG